MKGGKSGGRPHSLPIPPEAWASSSATGKRARSPARHRPPTCFPRSGATSMWASRRSTSCSTGWRGGPRTRASRSPAPAEEGLDGRPAARGAHGALRHRPLRAARRPARAIATYLDERRLGGAASAVLAHKAARSEDERERVEHVTRLHYAKGQRMMLKAEGMETWVRACPRCLPGRAGRRCSRRRWRWRPSPAGQLSSPPAGLKGFGLTRT